MAFFSPNTSTQDKNIKQRLVSMGEQQFLGSCEQVRKETFSMIVTLLAHILLQISQKKTQENVLAEVLKTDKVNSCLA